MTVALDGDTLYRWKVSTGAQGYETPSGNFRPFRLEKEHFSKEWDDAPMPHSIFFTGRGHAVHGSYHVKSLGRRASHGCVRLHPDNAAKLFSLVSKTGMSNTRVIVKGGFFDTGETGREVRRRKRSASTARARSSTPFSTDAGARRLPRFHASLIAAHDGAREAFGGHVLARASGSRA